MSEIECFRSIIRHELDNILDLRLLPVQRKHMPYDVRYLVLPAELTRSYLQRLLATDPERCLYAEMARLRVILVWCLQLEVVLVFFFLVFHHGREGRSRASLYTFAGSLRTCEV